MSIETEKDALVTENQNLKDEVERLKSPFIDSLVTDSKGYFKRDALTKLDIDDLQILRRSFDMTVKRDYQAFLDAREQSRKDSSKKFGTLGGYNQDTKEYEGGI